MPTVHASPLLVKSLVCRHCKGSFAKTVDGGRMPGYCSEACRRTAKLIRDQKNIPRLGLHKLTCEACSIQFTSRLRRPFCSRMCGRRVAIKARGARACKRCGKPIAREIGRGTDRRYCSAACRPKRRFGHGYVIVHAPAHPLANAHGWQFEHRIVLYDNIGPGTHACHWCKRPVSWALHYNGDGGLGVDHVDRVRTNNSIANLVPCCRSCNCKRRRKPKNKSICLDA
jgi:hypothetical protein